MHWLKKSVEDVMPSTEGSPAESPVVPESASDPEPQQPPVADPLTGLAATLAQVAASQAELLGLYETRIHSDQVQSKALEKLHDQLQDARRNFVREEMKPLLRDLTFCYDYAAEEADRAKGQDAGSETAKAFDHFRQMIADVLAKYDVEPFRSDSETFDQKAQQCVKTVPTGAEAFHKKVAAVGAVGFRSADLIVRKEQVTVYKYVPGLAAEDETGPKGA